MRRLIVYYHNSTSKEFTYHSGSLDIANGFLNFKGAGGSAGDHSINVDVIKRYVTTSMQDDEVQSDADESK
jgi:hypothetical protein